MHFHQGFSDSDPDDIFIGAVRNQGNSMIIQNGRRSLVSKVQNSEASIEMKDSESRARIGMSLGMSKQPKIAADTSDGSHVRVP